MELKKQLAFCNTCKNKKFDMNQGVLCGLTLRKPTFKTSCNDFVVDPVAQQKIAAKQYETQRQLNGSHGGHTGSTSDSSVSPWTVIVVILIVVRIIFRLMRD